MAHDEPRSHTSGPVPDTTILDGLGIALMAVDRRCRIIRFNGPAERLTGYACAAVIGQPCELVLRATLCNADCPVRRALRSGTSCRHGTVVLQTRSDQPVTVEVTASALFGDLGEIVGAVGLLREIGDAVGPVRLYGSRVFISRTVAMRRVFDVLPKLASSPAPLLIMGGRGSGRSALAETIHRLADQQVRPLVAVQCGELPRGDSPLVLSGPKGTASRAHGGTLLLEDICRAPLSLQLQLLAWLEERAAEARSIRLMSTSTPLLTDRLERGLFRRDLFYRLNVLHVALPDLKERAEDIPLLTDEFIEQLNLARGRQVQGASVAALRQLMTSDFGENVRELRSVIEVAHARCSGPLIEPRDLPQLAPPWHTRKARLEIERIQLALRRAGGSVTRAAEALGMHRTTLWRKIKRHGLDAFTATH